MRRYLLYFLHEVRNSYWFVPATMTLGAFALGFLVPVIDAAAGEGWVEYVPFLTSLNVDGARAMLTTIAGSIIGVAGVTFSIAIAAVSFASGNYGPRLIGNFMRDRGNQLTLGTFISAFVYCVVVLRAVHADPNGDSSEIDAFVPQASIMVAMVLMLASIGVLIFFIHHVPESINIMNIAARIGRDLKASVYQLLPDTLQNRAPIDTDSGDGGGNGGANGAATVLERGYRPDNGFDVTADDSGYLQQLDLDHLCRTAEERGLVARVLLRPGSFVTVRDPVMRVWREGGASPIEDGDGDELTDAMRACFTIGSERTNFQDVLFLVDELIEIAARALSPGVNDPFTANTCFDWLRAGLIEFVRRAPAKTFEDEFDVDGNERVIVYPVSFPRLMGAVMDQSRQYVAADRNATLHVLSTLAEVGRACEHDEHREVVIAHCERLAKEARAALSDEGVEDVNKRLSQALRRINDRVGADALTAQPRPLEPMRSPKGSVAA